MLAKTGMLHPLHKPVWSSASWHTVEKRNIQDSSPWHQGLELPDQEGAPGSSFSEKTGCSSLQSCRSCRPLSCPWRRGCMQLSTWHTVFPAADKKKQQQYNSYKIRPTFLIYPHFYISTVCRYFKKRQKCNLSQENAHKRLRRVETSYVVTSYVNLIHPISNWKQELDAKLLVCDIDIRNYLTTFQIKRNISLTAAR